MNGGRKSSGGCSADGEELVVRFGWVNLNLIGDLDPRKSYPE